MTCGNCPDQPDVHPDVLARIVDFAWSLGFRFALAQDSVAGALDDAVHASVAPPRLSYEDRVRQRIQEMEKAAVMVRQQIEAQQAGAPRRPWGCS